MSDMSPIAAAAEATAPVQNAKKAASAQSLHTAFAPPVEHVIEGTTYTLPLMTMDDWALCCDTLRGQRRSRIEARLSATIPPLSSADRAWLLSRADEELVTFSYAFAYRTQTPAGIKSTIVKALMKGNSLNEKDAKALVEKIPPIAQRDLASQIADPPVSIAGEEQPDPNTEDPASTNESGTPTPGSSASSSGSSQEA